MGEFLLDAFRWIGIVGAVLLFAITIVGYCALIVASIADDASDNTAPPITS